MELTLFDSLGATAAQAPDNCRVASPDGAHVLLIMRRSAFVPKRMCMHVDVRLAMGRTAAFVKGASKQVAARAASASSVSADYARVAGGQTHDGCLALSVACEGACCRAGHRRR